MKKINAFALSIILLASSVGWSDELSHEQSNELRTEVRYLKAQRTQDFKSVTGYVLDSSPLSYAGLKDKEISLTFDDGPSPETTPQVLKILKHYNIKATFFILGQNAEKHPEIVRQIVADGHVVANHT